MDGTILEKKYDLANRLAALEEEGGDVDERVTTLESAVEEINSNLTSKTPLIRSMLMFAIPTTSDGQHFTIDFSGFTFTQEKYAIMILYAHQSGTSNGVTVGMVYSGGFVFDSQANASYDATTKVLTVDCGSNAWTTPIILIPSVAIV